MGGDKNERPSMGMCGCFTLAYYQPVRSLHALPGIVQALMLRSVECRI